MRIKPGEVHDVLSRSILADGDPYVLDLEHSHGSYMVDAITGDEYLDFASGFASTALTYDNPALYDAEFEQRLLTVARHKPANSDRYTTHMAEFVDAVRTHVMPESHPHLFFVEGGAGAVENALKVAFDWKVRKNLAAGRGEIGTQVMHFEGAFHGRLGYTLSVTNTFDPRKYALFPKFHDWPRYEAPALTFPLDDEGLERLEYEERQALGEMAGYLEQYGADVAAILIEPIQGEGGDRHFRTEFLQGLRDLADRFEVMLIYDEVQTGMGLTGNWWLFQELGVEPDIFAFAKKMQVGGIAVNRRVEEVPDNVFVESSRINSTWGGDLTDMVRATQIIRTIVADDLLGNAREIGARLIDGLREMQAEGRISNLRGRGLMIAFDMEDEFARDRVLAAAYGRQMLLLGCGQKSVRLRPFLDVDVPAAEEFLTRIPDVLNAAEAR